MITNCPEIPSTKKKQFNVYFQKLCQNCIWWQECCIAPHDPIYIKNAYKSAAQSASPTQSPEKMHTRALLNLHPCLLPNVQKECIKEPAQSSNLNPKPTSPWTLQKKCIQERCSMCIAPLPSSLPLPNLQKKYIQELEFVLSPPPTPSLISRKNAYKSVAQSASLPPAQCT